MALAEITSYEFKDYRVDMSNLNITHSHRIRREPGLTLVDEYAHRIFYNYHKELFNQIITGWSRSYYDLDKHMHAILNYAVPDIPISNIDFDLYKFCINEVRERFHSLPNARAFDVLTELDSVPYKSSTAAGYDYIGAKGPFHGQNHKRGRSFHYILLEGTSASPLIKMFSNENTFYHIGRDPMDSVPEVLSEATKAAST